MCGALQTARDTLTLSASIVEFTGTNCSIWAQSRFLDDEVIKVLQQHAFKMSFGPDYRSLTWRTTSRCRIRPRN
jgi:hypothetical protein